MNKNNAIYTYGSAFAALLIWGGWAYWVNSSAGAGTAIVAGVTQGVASFVITLVVVWVVTFICNSVESRVLKFWMPAIVVTVTLGCLVALIHSLVGTPNILKTIAPSLSVTFVFCLLTSYKLTFSQFEIRKFSDTPE